jgi:hypothetical protein
MSAYLEPECEHPEIHLETFKCGCERCHACEEWINNCPTPRRCYRQEPGDIPAWYDENLCGDDR